MASATIVDRARSYSICVDGRCIASARGNHIVVDEPPHRGGAGEAITPSEMFLSGISACGVLMVQSLAKSGGVPLEQVEAAIEALRDRSNPSDFQSITIRFRMVGPTAEEAEQLVQGYRSN